jgi:hypothetical protein
MGGKPPRLTITALAQAYRGLLLLYPVAFRREYGPHMAQVFRDLCRDTSDKEGTLGLIGLLERVLIDTARSAPVEHVARWRNLMTGRKSFPFAVGVVVLAFPALFAVLNILQYQMGVGLPWNPFEALYARLGSGLASDALDMAIAASPLLALALFLLPSVSVRIRPGDDQLASVVIHKTSRAELALIAACLLVVAVFIAYLAAENLPCLLGQQLTC